jgi:hypothetical protein
MSCLHICVMFFLGCLSLFSLSSCRHNNYSKELVTLDSLQRVLDSSSTQYKKLDTAAMRRMFTTIQLDLKFIRDSRRPADTLNFQDAQQLNTYAQVYSILGALIQRQPGVEKELLYTSKQLLSLKSDVEKGKWEEKEVQHYCAQEREAVAHLQGVVKKALSAFQESKMRYEDVQPKVALLKERLQIVQSKAQASK